MMNAPPITIPHLIFTQEKYDPTYSCADCYYVTKESKLLKLHRRRYHSVWHHCSECPYKTYNRTQLDIHFERHTTKSEYKCRYCSYSSTGMRPITIHEKLHKNLPTEAPKEVIYIPDDVVDRVSTVYTHITPDIITSLPSRLSDVETALDLYMMEYVLM